MHTLILTLRGPQLICLPTLPAKEETPVSRLYISALTIGLSYFLGGLCPLLPYFFVTDVAHGLMFSSAVTLIILLLFGVAKTHFTGATGGVGGYLYGAISTMMVGGLAGASSCCSWPPSLVCELTFSACPAAGAAFGLVRLLEVEA